MRQGATPPNVTLTGPFRHLIGTSLFGAMAHFVYCVTLSVQEIAVKAISYPVDKNSISASHQALHQRVITFKQIEQPLCSTRRCIFSGLPRLNCSRRNAKRRCKSSLGKF